MGYYVEIIHSDFSIPAENIDEAYNRLISLNDRDDLKRGGSYGGENDSRSPRPVGYDYHPGKWFSWMDANYPARCRSLRDIFIELGFDVDESIDGDLLITGYDNKTGQEDIFLDEIIDLTIGTISWRGEDGQTWDTISGTTENAIQNFLNIQAKIQEWSNS